jgi:hypothetical protein
METPERAMMEIALFRKAGGVLSKRISLAENGALKSDGNACLMSRGSAERVEINSVADFGALIGGLKSDQAIALGSLRADLPDQVTVSTKRQMNGHAAPNVIARTAANIVFRPGPAFALIDFDTKAMSADVKAKLGPSQIAVLQALMTVMPAMRDAGRVSRLSTSAGLSRKDTGDQLAGSGGIHIYIAVKDATDIERFVRSLHDRCWLAGFGWMMIGAGGQLLERSIVDRMVGAPERLVFEGSPLLVAPLAQDQVARRPVVVDGDLLDTLDACPPLTVLEKARLRELQAKAAHSLAGEAAKARSAFIDKHADLIVQRTGVSRAAAKEAVAKQCNGVLLPTIELPFDDPEFAGKTVADVLADPERFEGETLADPLEGIEYGAGKAMVMLNASGAPWINSFAHGGIKYELKSDDGAKAVHWGQLVSGEITGRKRAAMARQITGHLLRRYVDPRIALELVLAWNNTRCQPPLETPGITTIVNSIAGRELARRQSK